MEVRISLLLAVRFSAPDQIVPKLSCAQPTATVHEQYQGFPHRSDAVLMTSVYAIYLNFRPRVIPIWVPPECHLDVICAIGDLHDIMIAEVKEKLASEDYGRYYVRPPYEESIWCVSPFAPADAYSHPARPNDGRDLEAYKKEARREEAEADEFYMREKAEEIEMLF